MNLEVNFVEYVQRRHWVGIPAVLIHMCTRSSTISHCIIICFFCMYQPNSIIYFTLNTVDYKTLFLFRYFDSCSCCTCICTYCITHCYRDQQAIGFLWLCLSHILPSILEAHSLALVFTCSLHSLVIAFDL